MKTFLNILPPEKKEDLHLEGRYRLLLHQEVGVFFLILFLGVLLSGVWLLLAMGEKDVVAKSADKNNSADYAVVASQKEVFSRVQSVVPLAQKAMTKQKKASWIFRSMEQDIAGGIVLSSIGVDGGILKISGHADTRDALLRMQENIQKTECFSQVTLPWSQIAEKENIDFEVTVSLDSQCFLTKK